MRAVMMRQFGDPSVLTIEETSTSVLSGDEVLVAIHAAAITPSDLKNVAGAMHGTTLPRIPGQDFAGVVAQGPAELVGCEVWGTGGELGFTRDGTHAEFVRLSREGVADKPRGVAMDAAGAAGVVFVTAWSALVTAAGVKAGETVVVIGAAGGVGAAAVQIARARGVRVIGVVRAEPDLAAVRELGAQEAINAKTSPVVETVRMMTEQGGADVVFDASGMMFAETIEAAAMDGRIPVIATPADGQVHVNLRSLYRKLLRVQGIDTRRLEAARCASLLEAMREGFEAGRLRISAVEAWPLEEAAEAYRQAGQGGRGEKDGGEPADCVVTRSGTRAKAKEGDRVSMNTLFKG